ncbi:hypothetical protein [Roseateles sp. LYH14W]|uniref:MBL fold metallo-hydrolase n=1 Tax=Pelomonas parva TaxID=3299032 RepID=A0ABW7EY90_9BURK
MPATKKPAASTFTAPRSPKAYRARVRMYRHGLGDCFLLTLPRKGAAPFNMLIDCGALARDKAFMTRVVEHIRGSVLHAAGRRRPASGKALLDVVVGTHEHKDHISGFNQARAVFNDGFDFGAVWLPWTENLSEPAIRKIKETRRKARATLLQVVGANPAAAPAALAGLGELLAFSADDDSVGDHTVAQAMDYLKQRGKDAGDLRFLKPGGTPFELNGVDGVRVYVLGPPLDPLMLKTSAVTEKMKREHTIFHLGATGDLGLETLAAAFANSGDDAARKCRPFADEHCIPRRLPGGADNPFFHTFMGGVAAAYDDPQAAWRRVDEDWLGAFGQLGLDLDNDTNNTSLVLAFEFVDTAEVLLFVADAQVGSWLSWADLSFELPGNGSPVPAHDLLRRTVFYKVGHHCSHNATLDTGGLALMTSDQLTAFIALDKATAAKQGAKGWAMPAPALFKALGRSAQQRVVISDAEEPLTAAADAAGVRATSVFVDYFLK